MKIMHEKVDFPGRLALKLKWREMPFFTYPWHFHPEYELLYVIDGSGTSFVADSIEKFTSGDLVLLGNNLPHFWRSDEIYHKQSEPNKVKYVVVQFPGDFMKNEINNYPEFQILGHLLQQASRGIRFSSEFSTVISKKILHLFNLEGFSRILLFLDILNDMANTADYRLLAGEFYKHEKHAYTNDRLTKVLLYINKFYQKKIELEKVAEIANLHPTAFCRYFKEKTGKSLSEYINDMRISYACKLLMEGQILKSQVCFESGFNNISNFNRIFKRITHLTPTDYFLRFHKND